MKTRNSLVSNSSSASFIVTWQLLHEDKLDLPIKEIIERLGEGDWHYGVDEVINELVKNTKRLDAPNCFETRESISMFNWMGDFNGGILPFVVEMSRDRNFKVINWEIESD